LGSERGGALKAEAQKAVGRRGKPGAGGTSIGKNPELHSLIGWLNAAFFPESGSLYDSGRTLVRRAVFSGGGAGEIAILEDGRNRGRMGRVREWVAMAGSGARIMVAGPASLADCR
jgi:hypothetical protein